MKIIIQYILFSIVLTIVSCDHLNQKGIEEMQLILSNFSTSSIFIAVDVTCKKETFPIVITNNTFYNILLQSGIVKNQEEYTEKVMDNILKRKMLIVNDTDEEILKGYLVIKNDSLNNSIGKNKKDFINKYFSGNKLRTREISFLEEKNIIYCLFISRTYCRRDCVSGDIFLVTNLQKQSSSQK